MPVFRYGALTVYRLDHSAFSIPNRATCRGKNRICCKSWPKMSWTKSSDDLSPTPIAPPKMERHRRLATSPPTLGLMQMSKDTQKALAIILGALSLLVVL